MDPERFFALRTGAVSLPDGEPAELMTHDLGRLRVESGRLAICDVVWLEIPLIIPVPPGVYRVVVTTAKVSEEFDIRESREAYLSLVCSDAAVASVGPATVEPDSVDWSIAHADGIARIPGLFAVPSADGAIAMVDAESIAPGMPEDPDTWFGEVVSTDGSEGSDGSDGWYARMDTDTPQPLGMLNAVLPRAKWGENIVMCIARGDKKFPLLETRDAAGALLGIHVDLLVIGELAEALGAFDGADGHFALAQEFEAEAASRAKARERRALPGFLGRLFGGAGR